MKKNKIKRICALQFKKGMAVRNITY